MTVEMVNEVAQALTSIGFLLGLLWAVFRFLSRQKQQDEELKQIKEAHAAEISHLREELQVLSYAMLAALDGLKQCGANGEVTHAHSELSKHLNKAAHRDA